MKASAGSGKTFNLARKYITLLFKKQDRYAYRHILAVTFTNKATDEMKNRILRELYILSSDPESSGYLKWFVPGRFSPEEMWKIQEGNGSLSGMATAGCLLPVRGRGKGCAVAVRFGGVK